MTQGKMTTEETAKKLYSVSFLKVSFGMALFLGVLFLSLGVMRIYVGTLEKRLSRVDSSLVALQNDYAQSIYAFAVATRPEVVLETSRRAQKMSISFHKTAMLHLPAAKETSSGVLLARKNPVFPSPEDLTSLKLAEKAFLGFFVPLASAQDEQ
jgi:hypothetical protein